MLSQTQGEVNKAGEQESIADNVGIYGPQGKQFCYCAEISLDWAKGNSGRARL